MSFLVPAFIASCGSPPRTTGFPETTFATSDDGNPIRCINSDKYATYVVRTRKYTPSFDAFFIKGTGHFLMMEKPDEFNHVLSEIVKDLVMGKNQEEP